VWGKACKTEGAAESVINSVGEIAVKIATAIKSNISPSTPEKAVVLQLAFHQ